ncbi:Helix-turn-helix domain-containing protein [Catalinimonas alkaloidigena]|uniref:Helix-turn-helix domain-containing protein n=1 Tax=Catalinimonas alkaloidigena TaxID=1075417 RepID=A0A1G9B901_9BACT|nr:helix-turn-helix domain-containing protein [Catalinimonas alkaloidigena]SDK35939.1 Helix-turn-helix domain-containing protein [Catalinimonas alkaloidigena]
MSDLTAQATKGDISLILSNMEKLEKELLFLRQALSSKVTVTVEEFATSTGLEVKLVQKYCREGKLKATQVVKGGSWVIAASEIDRLLKEAEANQHTQPKYTTRRNNLLNRAAGRLPKRKKS